MMKCTTLIKLNDIDDCVLIDEANHTHVVGIMDEL
jgi:uncharacterized protein YuzE